MYVLMIINMLCLTEYMTLSHGLRLVHTEILFDISQSRHTTPALKLFILYHVPAQMPNDTTEIHYLSHYSMVLFNPLFSVACQLHENTSTRTTSYGKHELHAVSVIVI